jgi:hypothetical protein
VTWGKLYKGIPQSKSRTTQVEDVTGFVEGLSSIDTRLLEISGNENALRLSEASSYLEAIGQDVASKMFYGSDAANPEQFMGLAPRFNALTGAQNSNQIVDAGGAGSDNTSIWFIGWGENTCHTLYPKGTAAGVQRDDKGEQRVTDSDGNAYYVKEEMFRQHMGVAVKDWRYLVRIANIDVSNLQAGSVNLYDFMRKAYWKLQNRRIPSGRFAIYCNRDVLEALDAESTNSNSSDNFARLRPMELQGKEILSYRGMPLRETDALLNTEAAVA